MDLPVQHFRLSRFARPGEAYHLAEVAVAGEGSAPYHDHDYHEVFWVEQGRGTHRLNGVDRPLAAGRLHLVRPEDCHRLGAGPEGPVQIVNLAFPSRTWREVRRRYFAGQPDPFALPDAQRDWPLPPVLRAELGRWKGRLSDPARPAVARDAFLMDLPRFVAGPRAAAEPLPDWLARACREIARPEHFAGGTPALAALAGRSPAHVARMVARCLGTTPTDVVNAARMDHAGRQLAGTDRPILDIALDCGLSNLSHFYALFRARYGVSPRRYRLGVPGPVTG